MPHRPKTTISFSIRLPDQMYGDLKVMAETKRTTMAEIVKKFIQLGLKVTAGELVIVREPKLRDGETFLVDVTDILI